MERQKREIIEYVSGIAFGTYIFGFIIAGLTFALISNKHSTSVILFTAFMCVGVAFIIQYFTNRECKKRLDSILDDKD
ncbi:hypothetical protein [Veillonella ratti]|uniref:hypothetical protein n=1 Tax=Veillonella ratti TaxID=103892 RepID=UPI000F8F822C|nr:hypothetical protein [Veillonella ratti]